MLDDLSNQLKGGLPIHFRRERFVGVECFRVGDCPVVYLVQDVLQEREGGWGIDAVWRLSA